MVARHYARATSVLLAFLLGTVAWGAYVRATGSGAGCGAHWPVCNGELVPRAPALATLIEFSHRVSSGLTLIAVAGWAVWGFLRFPRGHRVRRGALLGLGLMLVEALIGAALVLLRLVGTNDSLRRALAMSLHLTNTFFLLAVVAVTGAWAAGLARPRLRGQGAVGVLLAAALLGLLLLGISGALAALGDTLFPARSLAEGFRQDLSASSHGLLRLRLLHPALAVTVGIVVVIAAALSALLRPGPPVRRFAACAVGLLVCQLIAGLVNLALLAPVWMQLVHLLLADAVWLAVVLLGSQALAENAPRLAAPAAAAGEPLSVRPR
jgi:heme A synthase